MLKISILKKVPWLGILGSMFLFTATVMNDNITASSFEELSELNRQQMILDIQQVRYESWIQMFYQEKAKGSPDETALGISAAKALQSLTELHYMSISRLAESDAELLAIANQRQPIREENERLLRLQEWDKVTERLERLTAAINSPDVMKKQNDTFVIKKMKLKSKGTKFSSISFVVFVIGSFLIGFEFILNSTRGKIRDTN